MYFTATVVFFRKIEVFFLNLGESFHMYVVVITLIVDRVNLALIGECTSLKGLYDKGQIYRHEVV